MFSYYYSITQLRAISCSDSNADNPLSPNKRRHWCLECFELDRICKTRIERYGGVIIEYVKGFCEIIESFENVRE